MNTKRFLPSILLLLLLLSCFIPTAAAEEKVVATIYYSVSTTCGICVQRNQTLASLEEHYSDTIQFIRKNYDLADIKEEAKQFGIITHPSMVISFQSNETIIHYNEIPSTITNEQYSELCMLLEEYIAQYELHTQHSSEGLLGGSLLLVAGIAVVVILGVVGFIIWKKEKK